MRSKGAWSLMVFTMLITAPAPGQTASLGAQQRKNAENHPPAMGPREAPHVKRNKVYSQFSWVTGPQRTPKSYRVGDLITVIVRERKQFEADSDLTTKKRLDLKSQLDAFVKFTGGGIGAADFRRGKPTIDYSFDDKYKSEADTGRQDSLTLRLTGKIIDVKPNGILMIEARANVRHDDEISIVTVTGGCRKEDVTADNTILSTQLADKSVTVDNKGALRSAATRGWILRLLDFFKPV